MSEKHTTRGVCRICGHEWHVVRTKITVLKDPSGFSFLQGLPCSCSKCGERRISYLLAPEEPEEPC